MYSSSINSGLAGEKPGPPPPIAIYSICPLFAGSRVRDGTDLSWQQQQQQQYDGMLVQLTSATTGVMPGTQALFMMFIYSATISGVNALLPSLPKHIPHEGTISSMYIRCRS